jgi:hypothetical protein
MQPNNVGKRRMESLLQGLTGALRKTSCIIAACSLWSRARVYKRAIAACRLRATPGMTVICSARAPEASRAPDAHRLRARVLETHDAHPWRLLAPNGGRAMGRARDLRLPIMMSSFSSPAAVLSAFLQ